MTTRPDIEVIRQAVDLARRAPSLHNSQPWQFVLSDNGLRLFADPAVRLSEADPTGRQRLIGVGAVLDHLEIALGALGWRSQVTVLPDPNHPDHVATVDLDRADGVTQAHLQRAEAVARRYSHRMPMGPPRDWKVFLPFVCGVLSDRDVEVTTFDAADMPVVRRAARGANLARTYDWRYFTELSWWTASPQSSAVGIPPEVLPTSVEAEHVAVARDFPAAVRLIHGAGADDAAEIVAISTAADTPRDHVACGRALSTLLVEATAWGSATCAVSHLTESPRSRAELAAVIEPGWVPQILVRVGTACDEIALPRTERRPVDEIVTDTRSIPCSPDVSDRRAGRRKTDGHRG
ncbi:Acg family FMN-binding oxidoreductase [Williamsia sp. SKLECPSW1]